MSSHSRNDACPHSKDLEILNKVIRFVHKSHTLKEISNTSLELIMDLDNVDVTAIYLLDEYANEAVLYAHRNMPEHLLQEVERIPRPKGLTWKVINSGKPLNTKDAKKDPAIGLAGKKTGFHGLLGVPIFMEEKVIGVIWFLSYKERKFNKAELNLLSSLGNQIAIAIAKTKLLEDMKKLTRAIDQTQDLVFITNKKGVIEYVNSSFLNLTGYRREEVIGNTPKLLKSGKHDKYFYDKLWQKILSGESFSSEFINKKKNGDLFYESKTINPIKSEEGEITHFVSTGKDVTEQKHLEIQLSNVSNYDYLTGVLNRYSFEREIEEQILRSKLSANRGALIILDLDNFKIINDNFGYQIGDKVLIKVSRLLRDRLRTEDTLARVGVDEFAIFLIDADDETARNVATRMIDSVHAHKFEYEGESTHITVSAGIALFPGHGTNCDELLSSAELALYESKEKGGNCLNIYGDDEFLQTQIRNRRFWITRISDSLERDLFIVFAQPILNLQDNSISHYELLLRMKDENGEIIQPANFLGISERTGMIRNIDLWVVRRAMEILKVHRAKNNGIRFSINISNQSFIDDELLQLVRKEINDSFIDPASIQFEITETGTIANIPKAQTILNELRKLGCKFALDDFGKGFSSMFHLKHLSLDYLKIDGDFVRNLHRNHIDQHIVKNIVHLAKGFDLKLIAEHVENEMTMELLKNYDVHYAQGNYISPPQPIEKLL